MIQPDPRFAVQEFRPEALRTTYSADLFAWSGMALYALYLVGCLAALIPPRLLDPRWLQVAIQALVSNAMFPVIGTCLLVLAGFVDPDDPPGRFWLNLFRRWAWIGVLGYLLLIPLQGYTTLQLERAAAAPLAQEIGQLRTAILDVRVSRTMSDLGGVLAKLPGAPAIPPEFDVPLERFKAQIIETLSANAARLSELRDRQAGQRRGAQITGFLHTAFSCLIVASVFAAAAQARDNQRSLLQRVRIRVFRLRDRQALARGRRGPQERGYMESIAPEDDG